MGLFSSKTKIDVETTVTRVVDDGNVTDAIETSLIETFLGEDRDLTTDMINDILNSPILKFKRFHDYGKNGYYYGLPNATLAGNTGNEEVVEAVLEEIEGTDVNLEYVRFGFPDTTHFVRQILQLNYGMDYSTNEITALSAEKGYPVYLSDIQAVYKTVDEEADDLIPVGPPATAGYTPERSVNSGDLTKGIGQFSVHTAYTIDEDADADGADVFWVYEDEEGELHRGNFRILLSGVDDKADYFHALYSTDADGYRFFTYLHGEGTYPELDALHNPQYTDPGEYFPFVVFRRQKSNRAQEVYHDTEEYKSTVTLLEKLGMDYQDMSDSIHENPGIYDVEQAVMMMGVPIHSEDPIEQAYLFEYFYDLYLQGASSGIWIQDADFRFLLTHDSITLKQSVGTFGDIGDYTSERVTGGVWTERREYVEQPDGSYQYEWVSRYTSRPAMVFKKQVTEGVYYAITVVNPVIKYDIYKGEYVKGRIGDDVMLIPINKDVSDRLSVRYHEHLYLRSLHFVFNSVVKTKTKWYESSVFKAVLIVVTVVITVMTGVDFYSAMAVLLAEAGTLAVVYAMVLATLKTVLFKAAVEYIAKEAGAEFAIVAAVVSSIYGGYKGFQAGSLTNSPFATELINAGNGLANAANEAIQDEYKALMDEYKEFDLLKEEKMNLLEEAEALLDSGIDIDPLTFVNRSPAVLLGESPSDFFNRTVHAGNIGTRAFDAIHNYVDIALELPNSINDLPGVYV